MRIWDLPPELLYRAHLLGEHCELPAIWVVLTTGRAGHARHPETLCWQGKPQALWQQHAALVDELQRRGDRHANPLDEALVIGAARQDFWDVAALRDTVGVREALAWWRFDDTVIAVAVDRLPDPILTSKDQGGAD